MSTPVSLHYSPLDSSRFGRRIYRASMTSFDPLALRAALEAEKVETLIARISASSVDSAARLLEVGLYPIFADTHVDYDVALQDARVAAPDGSIALSTATSDDAPRIRAMARTIFDNYPSHYAANPLLSRSAIAEGYADWAARQVDGAGNITWLAERGGEVVGFSCCSVDKKKSVARGVLNGILPQTRGVGCYRAMFNAMLLHFRDAGVQTFAIATQVSNVAVQRVWADTGLRLRRAENTFHINCDF